MLEMKNQTIQELEEKVGLLQKENLALTEKANVVNSHSQEVHVHGVVPEVEKEPQDSSRALDEMALELKSFRCEQVKLKAELKEAVTDNQVLTQSLEKAEAEIIELATCITKEQTPETDSEAHTPVRKPISASNTPRNHITVHSFKFDNVDQPKDSNAVGSSLFSELDNQYITLQEKYEHFLQNCTCSASQAAHRSKITSEKLRMQGPLKTLFEDMFATLKKTSQLADELGKKNP